MGTLREILFLDENVMGGAFVDAHMILPLHALSNSPLKSLGSCHGHAGKDKGWFKATEYPYIIFNGLSKTYPILDTIVQIFNMLIPPDSSIEMLPRSNNAELYELRFGLHRMDEPPELKLARSQLDLYKFWALINILDESVELNTSEELTRLHLVWIADSLHTNFEETIHSMRNRKNKLPSLLQQYHLLLKETQTTKQNLHHPFE